MLSDPDSYVDLVEVLNAHYEHALKGEQSALSTETVPIYFQDAEPHFQLVADVFARFRLMQTATAPVTDGTSTPSLRIEAGLDGRVLRVKPQTGWLGLAPGDSILSLNLDAGDLHLLKRKLRAFARGQQGASYTFFRVHTGASSNQLVLLTAQTNPEGQNLAVISPVQLDWRPEIGEAMSRTFSLTPSEQDILRAIVGGQSLSDIAQSKGRSLATVRTQAKALLRKTEVSSQLDLVRMVAAMTLSLPSEQDTHDAVTGGAHRSFVVERDRHRLLQVDVLGPESGTAVFFVHGFVTGTAMSMAGLESLLRHNIRVIAPWRPGFAGSTTADAANGTHVDLVSRDIAHVMDHFGVERTILVARDSGVIYATAAAKSLGPRIGAVLAVAGTVPTRSHRYLDHIALWQRMFAYSARYFPVALPVLARGAMEMVANGKLDKLLAGLYAMPAIDNHWAMQPEIREILRESFETTFVQGTRGYEIDARQTATDWTAQSLEGLSVPVHYLHGALDPISLLAHVEELTRVHPHISYETIDDGGQLIWYSHAERVIEVIMRLARQAGILTGANR